MKKHFYLLLVLLVFLVGFFIRFYVLSSLPPGLNQDETAIGYNAYLIVKTGKDEYGHNLPLYFKSFGDYKLPVYVYLTSVAIQVFGLTPFAIRFWSAFCGGATVIVLFFLLRLLTQRRDLPLVASALLAINPWHLFFSRIAYEVTVANFLLTVGVFLFILGVHKKQWIFYLTSLLSFGLALYTYNVTRLVSPLLVVILILLYWKDVRKMSILVKSAFLLLFIGILMPFVATFFTGSGFASQKGVLIVGGDSFAGILELRSYIAGVSTALGKLLFNNVFLLIFTYLRNLVSFFSTTFFFVSGGDGNVSVGNNGMFYLFEFPAIVVGIYMLIRDKTNTLRIYIYWFLSVLLVVALSGQIPHASRDFVLIVPLVVFSAYGLIAIYQWMRQVKNKRVRKSILAASGVFIMYCVLYFFISYTIRFPTVYARTLRVEDKKLATYLKTQESSYDEIVIDPSSDFIYTSLLFYQNTDPKIFFATGEHEQDSLFIHLKRIGKYVFRPLAQSDLSQKILLVVAGTQEVQHMKLLQTFAFPTRPVVIYYDGKYGQYPTTDIAYKIYTNTK